MGEKIDLLKYKADKEEAAVNRKIEVINAYKLIDLINLVTRSLSQMAGNIQREDYRAIYQQVSAYGDQEVIGRINNFKEQEVQSDPLFYSVLMDYALAKGIIRHSHE
jgi:hypothetical protein